MKLSDFYQNKFIDLLYRRTEKPILGTMDWCSRHVGLTVIILLIIGMGLRIGYRGMLDHLDRDEYTYISIIEHLSQDSQINYMHHEDVALVQIGVIASHFNLNASVFLRVFNLSCSFLWLLVMYCLGKELFQSKNAGIFCLILAVFNPFTIRIAGKILREPLYILLFSCFLLCMIKIIDNREKWYHLMMVGFLCALGLWVRDEGIEFLIFTLFAFVFQLMIVLFTQEKIKQESLYLCFNFLLIAIYFSASMVCLYSFYPDRVNLLANRINFIFNKITVLFQ